MLVEGTGDQLLARTALAQNEDVHVLRGDAADGLAHLLHDRAATNDAVAAVVRRQAGGAHQTGGVEGALQNLAQAFEVHRLDKVVESSAFMASMAVSAVP